MIDYRKKSICSRINGAGQFVVPVEEVRENPAVWSLIKSIQHLVHKKDFHNQNAAKLDNYLSAYQTLIDNPKSMTPEIAGGLTRLVNQYLTNKKE